MISKEYDIVSGEHDDFFAAYVAALEQGVSELLVENSALIAILDGIYKDAVADIYSAQIGMPSEH
jgi:hypothetical protein